MMMTCVGWMVLGEGSGKSKKGEGMMHAVLVRQV